MKSKSNHSSYIDILFIAFIWVIGIIIINPTGNFPLNDDWSYGLVVKNLIETGEYAPTGWTSMTLLSHVLWGYLFCLPFGFSFEALRYSTLTISLIGIITTYLLIGCFSIPRYLKVIATLVIAFNPLYFSMSNTFMTDISFTTMLTIGIYFLTKSLQTDKKNYLIAATVFMILANLNRQIGLAIVIAFAIAYIMKNGFRKTALINAMSPAIFSLLSVFLYQKFLKTSGRMPDMQDERLDALISTLFSFQLPINFLKTLSVSLTYTGWFFMPILIIIFSYLWNSQNASIKRTLLIFTLPAFGTILMNITNHLMPIGHNIIDIVGIGPIALIDSNFSQSPSITPPSSGFWLLITYIGLLGALFLTVGFYRAVSNLMPILSIRNADSNQSVTIFFLLSIFIYMLITMSAFIFFDRYLLPIYPALMALFLNLFLPKKIGFSNTFDKYLISISSSLMITMIIFSIFATHDYLAWNRARWDALNDVMRDESITAKKIDGGFEYNGFYLYDPFYEAKEGKSSWWIDDDLYVITFKPIPNYKVIKQYNYNQWIGFKTNHILLMKRS